MLRDLKLITINMSGSRGETGADPDHLPLENHKAKSFIFKLAILVQIPFEITKLPIQHLMLGHHEPASKALFKTGFTGGPMMACVSGV